MMLSCRYHGAQTAQKHEFLAVVYRHVYSRWVSVYMILPLTQLTYLRTASVAIMYMNSIGSMRLSMSLQEPRYGTQKLFTISAQFVSLCIDVRCCYPRRKLYFAHSISQSPVEGLACCAVFSGQYGQSVHVGCLLRLLPQPVRVCVCVCVCGIMAVRLNLLPCLHQCVHASADNDQHVGYVCHGECEWLYVHAYSIVLYIVWCTYCI